MEEALETFELSKLMEQHLEIVSALRMLVQQHSECLSVDDVEVL